MLPGATPEGRGSIRIAQIAMRFLPATGGVERHLDEVARRLCARHDRVGIFVSDIVAYAPQWIHVPRGTPSTTEYGAEIHRLPIWNLPGAHYAIFRGMGEALGRFRPDLLHSHNCDFTRTPEAWRYGKSHDVPWVIDTHYYPLTSLKFSGPRSWFRRWDRGWSDRLLASPAMANAACIIVQSRAEEHLIRADRLPLPKVAVIPPGRTPLPPVSGPPGIFSRTFHVEGPYVLFVGRLAWSKGLLTLIRAFELLHRRDPTAHLVLVGPDEGAQASVELLARKLGIHGWLHLTGYLSDDRLLAAAYREARLFVLPSEYESFGIVALDAIEMGTPVVATAVGAMAEVLEGGRLGRLVPPGNVEELARALGDLWDDREERRRLAEVAQRSISDRYTWDRHVRDLEQLYSEVLRG